jgi:hypothetical protein
MSMIIESRHIESVEAIWLRTATNKMSTPSQRNTSARVACGYMLTVGHAGAAAAVAIAVSCSG